jgi:YYY domain-containing protein
VKLPVRAAERSLRSAGVAVGLTLLLVVGAVLRLQGLDWDLGQHLHPDERFLTMMASSVHAPASIAEYFDTTHSPLNPANVGGTFFAYGTLPLFVVRVAAAAIGWTDYDRIVLVGRFCSALFDLGTILLTFRLGLLLAGPRAGLAAAALMAFCVTAIQQAHYFTVDSYGAFFATASLLALAHVCLDGRRRWHVLFGCLFAATLACRINLFLLGLLYPVAVMHQWRRGGLRARPLLVTATLSVVAGAVVFRILQPYAFAGPGFFGLSPAPAFVRSVMQAREIGAGLADIPFTVQWIGRLPVFYAAWNLLLWAMGPAWGAAAIASVAWCLARRDPAGPGKRVQAGRVVLLWVPLLFFFHATQFVATIRYFLPVMPLLALATAWALAGPRAGRARLATLAVVLIATALWASAFSAIYWRPHPRVEASRWLYQAVPAGSTLVTEHWDDALPLGVDGRDAAVFTRAELPLYDQETEQKRARLVELLDRADVLVISSNRLYASIPRAPWRYPLARRYYELLFAGSLGFRLERVFTSYPALGPLEIPDDDAEEAFTVYDHPKVLVFRKTAEYSHDHVQMLLSAVSLPAFAPPAPRDASALYRRAHPTELQPGDRAEPAPARGSPGSVRAALTWALALELLALACFALLFASFSAAVDRGFAMAKLAAWLGPATLAWLFVSLGLTANSARTARGAAAALLAAGAAAAWRARAALGSALVEARTSIVTLQSVYFGAFAIFLLVRAFNPAIFWGEKPMDFAILNATLRSAGLPPADPWFAGEPLNYFYFGHFTTATFANVTGVAPAVAFNLALATVAALLATAVCQAAMQVTGRSTAGIGAAVLTVLAGNLAGPWLLATAPTHVGFDYFWSVSRVIPGTINEFPLWNLSFGDLHAHVLTMPLEAGLLSLGCIWLAQQRGSSLRARLVVFAMTAWVLGCTAVTSSWSAPVAVGLQLAFAVAAWVAGDRTAWALARVTLRWAALVAAAVGLFWPFWSTYAPPAGSWGWLTSEYAPIGDVALFFGIFFVLALPALGASLAGWVRRWPRAVVPIGAALVLSLAAGVSRSPACGVFVGCTALGLLVWTTDGRAPVQTGAMLVAAAGALGAAAETVFLWDHMNTVFKYYLEMWLMLAVGSAVLAWSFHRQHTRARLLFSLVAGTLVAAGIGTSATGVAGLLREPRAASPVPTLDGMAYLERENHRELDAYRWLNREVQGIPVVLEAQGPSYQAFTRVSMNTGLPTVLGWDYHLFQQGRPRPEIDGRAGDIRTIYQTNDVAEAERLLRRYHVDFVVVGRLERQTYGADGLDKFEHFAQLQRVFRNADVSIYATPGRAASVKTWIEAVPPTAPVPSRLVPPREPRSIAVASNGDALVADFGNRRVLRLDAHLRPTASFGREGSAPGEFKDPCGIAIAGDDGIFVADTWNHRVQRFTRDGQYVAEWRAGMYGPRGIAVAPNGDVYVTDTGNGRVIRFTRDGRSHVVVGRGELDNPVGIAVTRQGDLLVADTGHRRVVVFDAAGAKLREWPVDGWRPGSRLEPYLAVASDDVVWVTDPTGGRVLLFDRDGHALGTATPGAPLHRPLGIALTAGDTALVADAETGTLVEVRRESAAQRSNSGVRPAPGTRLQTPTRNAPAR